MGKKGKSTGRPHLDVPAGADSIELARKVQTHQRPLDDEGFEPEPENDPNDVGGSGYQDLVDKGIPRHMLKLAWVVAHGNADEAMSFVRANFDQPSSFWRPMSSAGGDSAVEVAKRTPAEPAVLPTNGAAAAAATAACPSHWNATEDSGTGLRRVKSVGSQPMRRRAATASAPGGSVGDKSGVEKTAVESLISEGQAEPINGTGARLRPPMARLLAGAHAEFEAAATSLGSKRQNLRQRFRAAALRSLVAQAERERAIAIDALRSLDRRDIHEVVNQLAHHIRCTLMLGRS